MFSTGRGAATSCSVAVIRQSDPTKAGLSCEYRKIIRVGMAIITLIPFALVLSAIDREVFDIVIESSWLPCVFTMTGCAVGSKSRCSMWRTRGVVIVIQVTPHTGVWCVIVITVVTKSTIIGDGGMSSLKHIVIIMIGHGCRHPD